MKIKVGDLIAYNWSSNLSFRGLVLNVKDSSDFHGKNSILYSFELLEDNKKRFWYDVWEWDDEDKIIVYNLPVNQEDNC